MAGAGRRTFQPGEVLTASNVNSYLMDQSVMRFADSTARGSAVGTAVIAEGMVSYLDDTNVLEVYDGSAWNPVYTPSALPVLRGGTGGTTVAAAQDNLGVGLVNIVPPTVNFSGGTATLNNLNEVAFTAVTSLSLNNIFSSAYSKYRLMLRVRESSVVNNAVTMRFRSGGVDNSTANYSNAVPMVNNAGVFSNLVAISTTNNYVFATTILSLSFAFATFDFHDPFTATSTSFHQSVMYHTGSAFFGGSGGGFHAQNYSADGITFTPASGNITGVVQVFGYNS